MSKRYSGKSFKDSSVMKKPKLTFKEKRKLKEEKKRKVVLDCAQIAPTSVPKYLCYNLYFMYVFIYFSILIIVIGVLLMVATPSVLLKFNWNEKTGLEKILMIIFYGVLLYIINIIYWFIYLMGRKNKEHRNFDRIILAVFLLVAFVYTEKFLMEFFLII